MEVGMNISPEALRKAGWEKTDSKFANCEIWEEPVENRKMLYDAQIEKIYLLYK